MDRYAAFPLTGEISGVHCPRGGRRGRRPVRVPGVLAGAHRARRLDARDQIPARPDPTSPMTISPGRRCCPSARPPTRSRPRPSPAVRVTDVSTPRSRTARSSACPTARAPRRRWRRSAPGRWGWPSLRTATLYVAHTSRGILRLAADGTSATVAECGEGRYPRFTDSLYVAADGAVWFTCPSQRFDLSGVRLDAMESGRTGRVRRWDPTTGETSTVLDGLLFANGITMSPDEDVPPGQRVGGLPGAAVLGEGAARGRARGLHRRPAWLSRQHPPRRRRALLGGDGRSPKSAGRPPALLADPHEGSAAHPRAAAAPRAAVRLAHRARRRRPGAPQPAGLDRRVRSGDRRAPRGRRALRQQQHDAGGRSPAGAGSACHDSPHAQDCWRPRCSPARRHAARRPTSPSPGGSSTSTRDGRSAIASSTTTRRRAPSCTACATTGSRRSSCPGVGSGWRIPRVLSRWGFLYEPSQFDPDAEPPPYNPANLPVGFTSHRDPISGEAMLDITCAACHTGQLEYGDTLDPRSTADRPGTRSRRSSWAQFVPTLLLALQATATDPFAFDRFARRIARRALSRGQSRSCASG